MAEALDEIFTPVDLRQAINEILVGTSFDLAAATSYFFLSWLQQEQDFRITSNRL